MQNIIVGEMIQKAEEVMSMPVDKGLEVLREAANKLAVQFSIDPTEVWQIYLEYMGKRGDA